MPALCFKMTVVNTDNFSVKETKEKSDNLFFLAENSSKPSLNGRYSVPG